MRVRPGSTVAIDRRRTTHRVVADARAANLGQSVGMCAVVRKRRRVRVFLELGNTTASLGKIIRAKLKLFGTASTADDFQEIKESQEGSLKIFTIR